VTKPTASTGAGVRRVSVQLRLRTEITFWRHGWLWLVTGVVLSTAIACAVVAGIAAQRETRELAQDKRALEALQAYASRRAASQALPAAADHARAAPDEDNRARLASVLLPKDQATDQLRRIYALAEQEQIGVSQAEFRSDAGIGGIERLQISLPTKAAYPKLRRFLEATLRALPNASLDRLTFARGQVGSPQIEAQVHLSLWFSVPEVGSRADGDSTEARP